jgi:hypothetical protein
MYPISIEIGETKMYTVNFFENKNLLLCQLLKCVPSAGEELKIKGRKGKVLNINSVDEKHIHVQVSLEAINKNKLIVDNSNKKKAK